MKASWHFAQSRRLALDLGYSECAALWLAIGNYSVDLRHWKADRAHGMTTMEPSTGRPSVDPVLAQSDWRTWIEDNVGQATARLGRPSGSHSAMYFLGMALHAVQDHEAHHGMTNAEHAKRCLTGDDPDIDHRALDAGRAVTREVLGRFFVDTGRRSRLIEHDCRPWTAYRAFLMPPDHARLDIDLAGFVWLGTRWLGRDPPVIRWPV